MKKLLMIGGILNFFLGLFHMFFWVIFDWPESLANLSNVNRGIMEVLNIHGTMVILFFGYVSIFKREQLLSSEMGKLVLLFITVFYLVRFVNEFIFWPIGMDTLISAVILTIMLFIYAIPTFNLYHRKSNRNIIEREKY